jgi:5-amino-6-(5-phosphoribosylamino)uracil reductase
MKKKSPQVTIMSAVSLDGKLSLDRGVSSGSFGKYLNETVLKEHHYWRTVFDGMMVGGNTVVIDNPSLTVRHAEGENPTRVIVDPEAAIPLDAKVFNDGQAPTIVAVTDETEPDYVAALKEKGVDVALCGSGPYVSLPDYMAYLAEKGIQRLMVEGGATINWLMLNQGLVDDVYLFVVPVVTGSKEAPSFVEGPGGATYEEPVQLEWLETKMLDSVQLVHYKVL